MTTWQEEARGIEPWVGARVLAFGGAGYVALSGYGEVWRVADHDAPWEVLDALRPILDLTDPDTLSAFDRRLALRLGAPVEAVREGVIIAVDEVVVPAERRIDGAVYRRRVLCVVAGLVKRADYVGEPLTWSMMVETDTANPRLARVRAWRSVKP